MKTTPLHLTDILPLTCTRAGTCCHGNRVWLNPWEIRQLAKVKKISITEFCSTYTNFGGIQLNFNGKTNNSGKKSCLLYNSSTGCSVHSGRPLACRMYPLGRQIQHGQTRYMFEEEKFPCLKECPEVTLLPKLRVDEYLRGQKTSEYEIAQEGYLEIVQNLADNSFALLLDTPLASSGDRTTLKAWRKLGDSNPSTLSKNIQEKWKDALLNPPISEDVNPNIFIEQHNEHLQKLIQKEFGNLTSLEACSKASISIMTTALYLGLSIGASIKELIDLWITIAKENGALE